MLRLRLIRAALGLMLAMPIAGGWCLAAQAAAIITPAAQWRALEPARKDDLIRGVGVGTSAAAAEIALFDPLRAADLRSHQAYMASHIAELRGALDDFYRQAADHERVPTHRALRYCLAKLNHEVDGNRWLQDSARVPRLASEGDEITVGHLRTPYAKDPTFVAGGREFSGKRYIAFGDLEAFYLKSFTVQTGHSGQAGLRFESTEQPIAVAGSPTSAIGRWAPDLQVVGNRVVLLYSEGVQNPDIVWPTFRLRMASLPLAKFSRQALKGGTVTFEAAHEILADLQPFGDHDADFGVIDPHFYVAPAGRGYVTYTVVRYGVPNKRYHEESVHMREVDPQDPSRALGTDRVIYEGRANTPDDGVAEAQDVVTLRGKTYLFLSSRGGDRDQRILVAPVAGELGPLPEGALQPLLDAGGAAWMYAAVGSSGTAEIAGSTYMVHQGMDRGGRFALGWLSLGWFEDVEAK